MLRRLVFVSLILGVYANASWAEQTRLRAAEIEALISGRTAVGTWFDDTYRQYFNPDGTTIYAVDGKRSSSGKWQVDAALDVYQSWWPRSAWENWEVYEEAEGYVWINVVGDRSPFIMEDGQQLLWPD